MEYRPDRGRRNDRLAYSRVVRLYLRMAAADPIPVVPRHTVSRQVMDKGSPTVNNGIVTKDRLPVS